MTKQANVYVDYQLGLLKVLKRIREKYPNVVMQDCASGGGRANYGLLPYFDEFWVSDNTDALQRVYIQWGTGLAGRCQLYHHGAERQDRAAAMLAQREAVLGALPDGCGYRGASGLGLCQPCL